MSLFFDAAWFDARLGEKGMDRGHLAAAAGLERTELHAIVSNERAASAEELRAFAGLLDADLLEVCVRAGISARAAAEGEHPSARIEDIEARLDALDAWIAEFEQRKRA